MFRSADELWRSLLACFYCGEFAPECSCCKACGKRNCTDPWCIKVLEGAFDDRPEDDDDLTSEAFD